jgi:hypothetical protein
MKMGMGMETFKEGTSRVTTIRTNMRECITVRCAITTILVGIVREN